MGMKNKKPNGVQVRMDSACIEATCGSISVTRTKMHEDVAFLYRRDFEIAPGPFVPADFAPSVAIVII